MKFIGGTHHGQEAPDWVQHLVVAGWVEIEMPKRSAGGGWGPAPQTKPELERYVVRTWTTMDGQRFKFLAEAERDRAYLESIALPLFKAKP
ncbi:MAG: hypothetical protein ACJ8G7_21560 [Rhizobacter sp.]